MSNFFLLTHVMFKTQYTAADLILALRNVHVDAQQYFNFCISSSVNPVLCKGRFAVVTKPLK